MHECDNDAGRRAAAPMGYDKRPRDALTHIGSALIAVLLLIGSMIAIVATTAEKAYAAGSVHYTSGEEILYGEHGWVTHKMNCDDAMAYCVQPSLNAPSNGSYQKEPLAPTNASARNIRALLWFGYGGPGFDASMWPAYYSDGTRMYGNLYYALTHVILANYYYSAGTDDALQGLSAGERDWLSAHIMPIHDAGFGFSGGDDGTFVGRCFARSGEIPEGFESFTINSGNNATQTILSFVSTGDANVEKVSANHSISDYNANYKMSGIIYDIYGDAGCTMWVGSVTLDASGRSNAITVSHGRYYVRERESSCIGTGYAHDSTVHGVDVIAGRTSTLRVSDVPQYAIPELLIAKVDAEAGAPEPLGSATLAGAMFRVDFYGGQFSTVADAEGSGAMLRTWTFSTDERGRVPFDREHLVGGDAPYTNAAGNVVVPLGTLVMRETAAPTGYLLNGDDVHLRTVAPSGTSEVVGAHAAPNHPDQVKRGDIEFIKTGEADMSRLSHVGFRLTSKTTGESHVLVTDENGYGCSKSDWNAHTASTNGNDEIAEGEWDADRGVWFGKTHDGGITVPDDLLGALPYDDYTLTELPCAANEGYELLTIDDIAVRRDSVCVNLGTIDDPLKQTQYITSVAYDATDLDKTFPKGERVRLVDSVNFTNLIPGEDYTLITRLVYRDGGGPVLNDGAPVERERSFTASGANGKTGIEVEVDTTSLESEGVVFFETLYKNGSLLAQDCDLDNPDQTLRLQEPQLRTVALDGLDGDKTVSATRNCCVTDTVDFSGLIAGEAYTLRAELMIADAAEDGSVHARPAIDADGDGVGALTEFTAEAPTGQVSVSIPFDGLILEDDVTLVVFERLYQGGSLIDEHCDPTDDQQSVRLRHPSISTSAHYPASASKLIPIDAEMRIVDSISYFDVAPGEDYTLVGELADATTGELHGIGSRTTFTAEDSQGTMDMEFVLSETGIDPDHSPNIVIYQYLYQAEELVASHDDAANADQTVVLAEPRIFTEALDGADGDHEIAALTDRTVVDTVYYENLIPGKEYALNGCLMDKATGSVVDVNGSGIDASLLFTPNAPTGHIAVEFRLDASSLNGREIVAFEELSKDDELIAVHTDIGDERQTVSVTDNVGGKLPQTGDGSGWTRTAALLLVGILLTALLARSHRASSAHAAATSPGGTGYGVIPRMTRRAKTRMEGAPSARQRLLDSIYRRE